MIFLATNHSVRGFSGKSELFLCAKAAPLAAVDFLPGREAPGPRAAQRGLRIEGAGDGGETIEDGADQGRDQDLGGASSW